LCDWSELSLSEPAVLWPPLALSAASWPLLAFPEPALLAPPLAVSAVDDPFELLPPLAVSAVPVPPPLGVSTRADSPEAEPCCPAWLLPSLAALEIAAPLLTPVSSGDGRSVSDYSVLAHPVDGRPGIAYGRELPRLVSAQALDEAPAGRTGSHTKGASVSMQEQGGAQEPESPDQTPDPTPGEPGTMPDDPSPAPDAPTMPEDPDRDPSQSPPDEPSR
jgi:hypothetical protein